MTAMIVHDDAAFRDALFVVGIDDDEVRRGAGLESCLMFDILVSIERRLNSLRAATYPL